MDLALCVRGTPGPALLGWLEAAMPPQAAEGRAQGVCVPAAASHASGPLTAGLWQGPEGPACQTGSHPDTGALGAGSVTGWGGLAAYEGFMHNLKGPVRPWMAETPTPSQGVSGRRAGAPSSQWEAAGEEGTGSCELSSGTRLGVPPGRAPPGTAAVTVQGAGARGGQAGGGHRHPQGP